MTDDDEVRITVRINGADENPWGCYGLKINPFPQTSIRGLQAASKKLARLDDEPVSSAADIRKRLRGCSDELIDLCVQQWMPGQRVEFTIKFPSAKG
jgi:hypothetical protein